MKVHVKMAAHIFRHVPVTLYTPVPEQRPFLQHIKEIATRRNKILPSNHVLEIKAQVHVWKGVKILTGPFAHIRLRSSILN